MAKTDINPLTDINQLKFNQALLVAMLPVAWLLGQSWIVAVLAVLMLSQHTPWDLLQKLRGGLRIPSRLVEESPLPHRFARTVGGIFLAVSAALLIVGWVGWLFAAVVFALALLSLTTQICVGCWMYFQLRMFRYRFSGSV
jgi:hypothetical protein